MGLDPFNFADAMLGVLAKRLCKRICPACKESYRPSHEEFDELARAYGMQAWEQLNIAYDDDFRLHRGGGCEACNHSGFKGRVALHELFRNSEEIKNLIQSRAKTSEIQRFATKAGMTTLLQDGIHKVLAGYTTYKQVRSVAMK
jgi:type II secretory ATPase GspE/PulE/Tfp pilus assembly ATPase PilB-like protein